MSRQGGSGTRPYLDQHHPPFAIAALGGCPQTDLRRNPVTVGARHALPLPLRTSSRPSPRAIGRGQDAGATTQQGRVWDPPLRICTVQHSLSLWCSRQGRSAAARLQIQITHPHSAPPFAIRYSLFLSTRRSLLAVFSIRHSLFASRRSFHSPLAVFDHSPLATRHSPSFTTHRSLLAARYSPSFTMRCLKRNCSWDSLRFTIKGARRRGGKPFGREIG
jgi:hypothetical protein